METIANISLKMDFQCRSTLNLHKVDILRRLLLVCDDKYKPERNYSNNI